MGRARAFSSSLRARPARIASLQPSRVHMPRRDVVLSGAAAAFLLPWEERALAAEKVNLPVSQLSTFERAAQKNEVLVRSQLELAKVVTAADVPKATRLVFNDAATFDLASKTGGMNGSVVLSPDEAGRPENADLAGFVDRLRGVKAAIDEGNEAIGAQPISWADLIVLAAKVAVQSEWRDIKINRAALREGGEQIVKAFGAAWDVRLGRVDSADADPAGRVPPPGTSPEEVRQFMLKLGSKPGDGGAFAPKPPFWERPTFVIWTATQDDRAAAEQEFAAANSTFAEFKKKYDNDRKTTTRTNYEVDFINYFTKLTTLGATFDPNAYLHSVQVSKLQ